MTVSTVSSKLVILLLPNLVQWYIITRQRPCRLTYSGGDVAVYVLDIDQSSLPTPSQCSVLVSISVFLALLSVYHSLNFPNNNLLSHSVLPVLFLPYWSFQLYTFV